MEGKHNQHLVALCENRIVKASMYMRLFDFGELLERLVRVARGKVGESRGTVRPVEAFPCGVLQTTLVQKLFNRRN